MKELPFLNLIDYLRVQMAEMTDEQRIELADEIMAGYCHHCGSAHLPCYCQRDD